MAKKQNKHKSKQNKHENKFDAYKRNHFPSTSWEDSEFATEVAPPVQGYVDERKDAEDEGGLENGRTIGWVALVLALASLVLYPVPLSAAAIVLGSIAYVRGSRPLGAGAVIIGILSLVIMLVLVPMLF